MYVPAKVVWLGRSSADATWEPESTLPAHLIQEFEGGLHRSMEKSMFSSGGQTHTTISTKLVGDISQLPHKRPRVESFIDSANTR